MEFIADLHIHSRFSRATSKDLTPEHLDRWAQLKGIDVIGTGDATHPGWLAELEEKLEDTGNGLYCLKKSCALKGPDAYVPPKTRRDVHFILSGEISSIYKKGGRVRKVHTVFLLPDFKAAKKLQERLVKHGGNITSDGRPILGIDARDILEMLLEVSGEALVIPAHVWTPWFSVLGDKSGFNSLEECYEDLTGHIFAVETGLSSDPPMNWACSFLDRFKLVSNSDAHSPEKLGREANLFDTALSYSGIYEALKSDKGLLGTVEFFPEEGKYHFDGHRKCGIRWDPVETVRHQGICPVCGKPVTRGVLYRVAELADRKDLMQAGNRKEYRSITSLPSLVAEIAGTAEGTKKATRAYFNVFENVGSDFHTLLFASLDEIKEHGGELLAEGIRRLRCGEVEIEGGFDGEFGRVTVFRKGELEGSGPSLFVPAEKEQCKGKNVHKNSIMFDIDAFKKAFRKGDPVQREKKKKAAAHGNGQEKALESRNGVCIVIAGPGSGKTYLLTQRIVRLIKDDRVPQENILAITFSNKAAEEIRARLSAEITPLNANVSTFHAFGLSVLKKHCRSVGRSENFSIVDEEEKGKGRNDLKKISDFKQGIVRDDESRNLAEAYDRLLRSRDAVDLDDLVYLPVKLFRGNDSLREEYRRQNPRVLVDEWQDINPVQYELVRLLCGDGNPSLFVIGDPDQAIYGFRGSDARAFGRLRADYPNAMILRLEKSFRCPSVVLKAAGQVLRKETCLEGRPEDIKIEITECETDRSEADLIAATIEKMIGGVHSFSLHSGASDGDESEGIAGFSDFAVLCRTSLMFEPVAQALIARGIPVQTVGTEPFPVNEPFKGLLKSFKDALYSPARGEIEKRIQQKEEISRILSMLVEEHNAREDEKKRFIALGQRYGSNYDAFFRDLSLRKGMDDLDRDQEAVRIMTIHAAKGLEFKAVFVPGCEEGMIPFTLFGEKTAEELAEEERLFYVAMTRTERYLHLTYSKKRLFKDRLLEQRKSSLLQGLEQGLLHQTSRTPKKHDPQLKLKLFEEESL